MNSWNPFSKIKSVKCPDGSTKYVYKHVDHAFPILIKNYEASISAKQDSALINGARISGELKKRTTTLLADLDRNNNDLIFAFRSAYLGYQTDPCKNNDYFLWQMNMITIENQRLKRLSLNIRAFVDLANNRRLSNPDSLAAELEKLEDLIRDPDKAEIRKAFKSSTNAAKQMNREE